MQKSVSVFDRGVAQTAAFRFGRIDLGVKRSASPGTSRSPCTFTYLWRPYSVRTGPLSGSRRERKSRYAAGGMRRRNESPAIAQTRARNSHISRDGQWAIFQPALKLRKPVEERRILKERSARVAAETEIQLFPFKILFCLSPIFPAREWRDGLFRGESTQTFFTYSRPRKLEDRTYLISRNHISVKTKSIDVTKRKRFFRRKTVYCYA